MTRETRIGLLVGLMFIVMFGLVLGELTGPPAAERPTAVAADKPVPYIGIPVRRDIRPIGVGPAGDVVAQADAGSQARSAQGQEQSPVIQVSFVAPQRSGGGFVSSEVVRNAQPDADRRLQADATVPGEVSAVRHRPQDVVVDRTDPAPANRTYTVEPNDSLIRIAKKVYGPAHARQYKRIYQANRDKLPNEATVYVGQQLVIPPLPGESVAAGPVSPERRAPTLAATRGYREVTIEQLPSHIAGRASRRRVYVVQRGDNLTKIARKVLNDDSRAAVRRLHEANKDRIADPDRLSVGVELEIPS